MKLYRNAIILTVILALLLGAYVLLSNRKGTEAGPEETADNNKKVFEIKKDDITEITVDNEMGRLVFTKNDKEWVLSSPSGFKAANSKIESIAFEMSNFDAEKVIEENAADLSKYGLDKPITVSVKLKDGSVKTVLIGSKTPSKSGYYIKTSDNNKIYTIGYYKAETLMARYSDIRDKVLFEVKPEDVTGFALERDGNLVFTAKKTGEFDWELTAPIEASVRSGSIDTVIEPLLSTTAKEFVEKDPADLGKYGLDKPSYVIEIATKSGVKKMLLGDEKVKGSEIYAKFSDSSEVFVLYESSVNFVDKPLKEVVDVFAYIVNIKDVEKIVVEMDGQTVVSEIQTDPEGDTSKDKFYVNGKDASMKDENDDQPFRKYYQGLIGITMSDLEIGAQPSGKPEITFTYYLKKEPKVMKVEFIPRDELFYYVVKNGKYSNIVVAKKKFDESDGPRETYKKLVEAMEKAEKK